MTSFTHIQLLQCCPEPNTEPFPENRPTLAINTQHIMCQSTKRKRRLHPFILAHITNSLFSQHLLSDDFGKRLSRNAQQIYAMQLSHVTLAYAVGGKPYEPYG